MNEGSAEKCPKELTTIKTFGADKQTNKKEGRKEGEKGRKECQERPHRSATDKVIIGAAAGSTNKVGGHNRLHYNRKADKISERASDFPASIASIHGCHGHHLSQRWRMVAGGRGGGGLRRRLKVVFPALLILCCANFILFHRSTGCVSYLEPFLSFNLRCR